MIQVVSSTRPRARIEHRCSNCGRTIAADEVYRRAFLIGDGGDPWVWKECVHCAAFVALYLDQFAPWADVDGYDDESIREWEPDTDEAAEHRRQWLARWRDGVGALVPVPTGAVDGT